MRHRRLRKRERRHQVDLEDVAQHVEGIVGERGLRARAEQAGVVDDRIDTAEPDRRLHQCPPMTGIGDVARDGDDGRDGAELLGGLGQRGRAPGVEHERPAVIGEPPCQGEAEAP